jgi:hypothetical protein
MFSFVPEPSDFQRQIARWILAICLASLEIFLVGGIILRGSIDGFRISAGGGAAILIASALWFNPFPGRSIPLGSAEWKGGVTLGALVIELREAYADGRIKDKIEVDPAHSDEVMNFLPGPADWTGKTWIQLFQRICTVNRCLKCNILPGGESLRLSVAIDSVSKHCVDNACSSYWYTCK